MPFISLKFDDDDMARLKRVMAKYKSNQIQAFRLGLIVLDSFPAFQIDLPPRRKPGPKPKGKSTAQ